MFTNSDIDAKLVSTDGLYDVQIGDDGGIETVRSFDTAIIISLFTDRRASASEVASAGNRRGWVGNLDLFGNEFEYGSKIWLYEQSRLTDSIRVEFEDSIRVALQWIVDDQHASNIEVNSSLLSGFRSGIAFLVRFFITPDVVDTREFVFWNETGQFEER